MGVMHEYDDLVGGPLAQYVDLSKQIGGLVYEQARMVQNAFTAQREFLLTSLHTPKPPTMEELQKLLAPTSTIMESIHNHRDLNRTALHFNHLSAVSEAIAGLGWVIITPDPSGYAKELHGAAAYYAHKVMAANKDKNTPDVKWARAWLDVLSELCGFIRRYYRAGLTWNTDPAQSHTRPYGAPLPPPPPPMEAFGTSRLQEALNETDTRSALLRDLNKGADITKCLKKVDKSTVRKAPVPLYGSQKAASIAAPKKMPPKLELEGRKWCVEHQENADLKVDVTSMNQSIYVYKCNNSQITVKGKVNCIILDSCKKIYIAFEDLVSSFEVLNSERIRLQPMGTLPIVILDKSDGVLIYASKLSLDMEVVSSKSSEINIALPDEYEGYLEKPVPEQLKTTIVNGKLVTVALEKM